MRADHRRTLVLLCFLSLAALSELRAQTFTASGPFTVNGSPAQSTPYPLTLAASGLSGTLSKVTVTLTGLSSTSTFSGGEFMVVLKSPTGEKFELLSQYCNDDQDITSRNLTFDDAAATQVNAGNGNLSCGSFPSGTFKPTVGTVSTADSIPGITVTGSQTAAPRGTGTMASNFTGGPNGTWSLYLAMQTPGFDTGTLSSWSLTFTMAAGSSTTTSLSRTSGTSPSTAGSALTFQAVVSPTVSGGTVAFKDNGVNIAACSSQPLSGGTTATCSTAALAEGAHNITAAYSGTSGFGASTSAAVFQVVRNQTTVSNFTSTSGTFCNPGTVTLPGTGANDGLKGDPGSPYASEIVVSGLTGVINNVTFTLNNYNIGNPIGLGLMAVAPSGNTLDFLSWAGGTSSTSAASFTISDTGSAGHVPAGSPPLNGSSYQPTSYASGNGTNYCQASDTSGQLCDGVLVTEGAPNSFVSATPQGTATLVSQFGGSSPNGTWKLFADSRQSPRTGSIGGWCVNITTAAGDATTTVVASSQNSSFTTAPNNSVTFTATVTDAVAPATTISGGTVAFTSDGVLLTGCSTVAVANNTAQCTTLTLTAGAHSIQAVYSGTSSFGASIGTLTQHVDNHTVTSASSLVYSYCDPGAIRIPAGAPNNSLLGLSQPYPSNIFVSNLPGTVNSVGISLGNLTFNRLDQLASLVVGPNGNLAQSLDVFSQLNTVNPVSGINVTLNDSGSNLVSTPASNGTYKPYSGHSNNSYPSPAPVGPYNYAAPAGSTTFASIFGNGVNNPLNPAGTWSFFTENLVEGGNGTLGDTTQTVNPSGPSWCVNLTINPPVLSVTKSHTGNFQQGQQGATFTIQVHNAGPGAAGGVVPVKVTDTLPAGLTPAASPGSGTNWSCSSLAQVITCTSSDLITAGNDFPALTLFVNVAANASSPLSNTAGVTGGGAIVTANSTADSITVVPPPALTLSKNHVGTFTQGSTGQWNLVVGNSTAGSVTTGAVTVVDTLPAGYTLNSFTGAGWNCTGTGTVTCTATPNIAGGSNSTISLTVNIPANSAISITNNAVTFGGGDINHATQGTGVTALDTVTVVQVPVTISATGGTPQNTNTGSAFPLSLQATVKDAASVLIANTPVIFTAPGSGASGLFSNSTTTITVNTNASGIASAPFAANATGGSYTVTATAGAAGPASFSLTNNAAPLVSVNPQPQTVCAGSSVSFTSSATGFPAPTIQWQVSTNGGGSYTNVGGAISSPFTHTALAPENNNLYRAVFTNVVTSANSTGALLTVNTAPLVTLNPVNANVNSGQTATFTAAASGQPSPTAQWQVSTDGGATFTDIGGATSTTLAFTAAGSMSGYKYRAVFTSPAGCASPATTTAATLGVNKLNPVITWSNPANTTFGGALSNVQLNATASVPGTFVYTPPVGTVLPAGNAQTLSVLFTPTDTVTYNTATATVLINVLPAAGPATLVITRTLSRDGNNDVLMTLTIANTGGSPATAVQWTTVKIGTVDTVTPLPAAVPNVPAGGSQVATFRFAAASVGASGSAGVASYNGVYTGGTFGGSSRITLP